jgi:hypothetical protein
MNYGQFTATGNALATYTDSLNITRSYNTFWGMNRFNIVNTSSLQFDGDFTPSSTVNYSSLYPMNNLNFLILVF